MRTIEERDALIEQWRWLPLRVAWKAGYRRNKTRYGLAIEEAAAAGMATLVECAEQWNESNGASFKWYAATCIRRAIMEEARRHLPVWVPQAVFRRTRRAPDPVLARALFARRISDRQPAPEPFDPLLLRGAVKQLALPDRVFLRVALDECGLDFAQVGMAYGLTRQRSRAIFDKIARRLRPLLAS